MKLETFFEKFELFADAPDAVTKMRELVLELAARGKLVEQNPSEGDGHSLLSKIRMKNPLSDVEPKEESADQELPNVPSTWATSKLGEVAEIVRGVSFPGSAKSEARTRGDVACLRTASVQAEIEWDHPIYISPRHVSRPDQWVALNDIIISMANSYALVGKVAIVRQVPEKATFGAFLAAIRPVLIEPYFLLYVLRSPQMQSDFRACSSQTTNIANISLGRMRPLPFPLPPLAEQKRIVAKVDELMTLCDRLEAQQQERETRHAALARASLARFAEAPTLANLNFIFHKSYDIRPEDLRKSILTLAVQGKLLPQDPGDESAEELFAQLRSFALGAKQKSNTELAAELPFEIPPSWKLTRLDAVTRVFSGNAFPSGDFQKNAGIKAIKITNVGVRAFKATEEFLPTGFDHRFSNFMVRHGDILIALTRPYILEGLKVAKCPESYDGALLNQRVGAIQSAKEKDISDFLFLHLCSPFVLDYVIEKSRTLNQPNLNIPDLRCLPLPLPPHVEQRRIVAKVDQLMALVDELEKQLAASRATAANLLSALVAELTNRK